MNCLAETAQRLTVGGIYHGRRLLQHFADTTQSSRSPEQGVGTGGQLRNCDREAQQHAIESHQRAHADVLVEREVRAPQQDDHVQHEHADIGQALRQIAGEIELLRCGLGDIQPLLHPAEAMRLEAERLDRGLSFQILLHQAQHVGIAAPRVQAHRSRTRQQPAWPDPAQRRQQRDGQRHLNVQREQRKAQQQQAHRGAENYRQRAHNEVFHGRQVSGETRHQVAWTHRREVANRQALQVGEQPLANAAQHCRAQSRIQVIAPDHSGRRERQARGHQQHDLQQQRAIRRDDGLIDQKLQAQWQCRLIGNVDHQAEHHVEHETLVRRE